MQSGMHSESKKRTTVGRWVGAIFLAALVSSNMACAKKTAGAPPPPEVKVAVVQQKDVPVYGEWIGTLDGYVNADVKAQVSGYLIEQAYKEGSFVHKGQLLFQIDPRPFQAALDQAKGELAQAQAQLKNAEANQVRTQLDVDKYTPLAKEEAASQQDLDNAVQNNLAAIATVATVKAQIESAQAAVEQAQINLNFTHLIAPIDGIAGIAQLQVGALVNPSSPPVTTVSTVDPIKVYFTVSEPEYLEFNRWYPSEAEREEQEKRMPLQLILADGTTYPRDGSVYFADRAVDLGTGTIRIAGLFPNPGNILRPGGYGKIRAAVRTLLGAVLVPQRAVTELQGSDQVAVVDQDDKISLREVETGDRIGSDWVITKGLNPGERVVVEGFEKIRAGMQVNARPYVDQAAMAGEK
jgi:RND family efflux transporter MFP subunit